MLKFIIGLIFLITISSCTKDSNGFGDGTTIISLQEKARNTQSDSTHLYLKKAEQLLLKNSSAEKDSLLMENYFALGEYFASQKENDSSVYYNFKGLQSIDSISSYHVEDFFFDSFYELKALSRYGDCKKVIDEYETKVDTSDYERVSNVYYFRENIAKSELDYPLALEYNKKRVEYLKKLKDPEAVVPGLTSRAVIYRKLGKYKNASEIYESLIEGDENFSYDIKRQVFGNYAVLKSYLGQYEESIFYQKKALVNIKAQSTSSSRKNNSMAVVYDNLAGIHIQLKQYKLAQQYLDSVQLIGFNKIRESTQRSVIKYQLALQSLANDDMSKANNLLDSIFSYQDKSYEEKYSKELVALKIETEKKEAILAEKQAAEIKAITLENRLIIVIISSLLALLIGVLYFFLRKYRQEKKALYMQQRLLRTQMSPHFIFNTLSSIHNVMSTNSEKASNYLLKFSRLLRLVLENSLENYVPLEDEIESIEQFMALQLLRFPEKFEYNISLENLNSNTNYLIPPMLLQPFIENSILHGFKGIEYQGNISISISEKNRYLQCVIEDNGTGIQEAQTSLNKSVSVGLISDFIEKATKSKISIISKIKGDDECTGVNVSFLIPFKTNTK